MLYFWGKETALTEFDQRSFKIYNIPLNNAVTTQKLNTSIHQMLHYNCMFSGVLLRLEFQVAHPTQSTNLVTD